MQRQELHPVGPKLTTRDKVLQIISRQLGVSLKEIDSDDTLVDTLGAQSVDLVEIIVAIEEDFDIEIKDEEVDAHQPDWSVEEVVQLVRTKTGTT